MAAHNSSQAAIRLAELGQRICILGPSNSGKSTLAAAIGDAQGLPVVHLDVLRHVPGSQWVERDADDFGRLHDAAIDGERWVIEGNYSHWLAQRLNRATGLIVLDVSTATSLARYLRRTLLERNRHGGIEGVADRLNVRMISWIVGQSQKNRAQYRARAHSTELPAVLLPSRKSLRRFYREEHLRR
jgi:adenylate kinase family enzyme